MLALLVEVGWNVNLFNEANWEVVCLVESAEALIALFSRFVHNSFQAIEATEGLLDLRLLWGVWEALDGHLGLSALEHKRLFVKQLLAYKNRILYLYKCSECAIIIFYEVLGPYFSNVWMHSRHGYVIAYSNIARGVPSNLQDSLVFCVQNEEYFAFSKLLSLISRAQRFKNNEVIIRPINLEDINDSVVDWDRKWELLLA